MYIPFEEIPSGARIWIYQANRKLTDAEKKFIIEQTQEFLQNWAAHGQQLASSAKVLHDQFLILSVNEEYHPPSGCSIDSSVHFVKALENEFQISFFDRSKVAFLLNDEVFLETLPNIKKKINEGIIKEDTLTFNNLIDRKGDLENNWMVPAKKSWLHRYF